MLVTPIKTHKITSRDKDIFKILDKYIKSLEDKSVVAVTSKIVAIAEGRIERIDKTSRDELVEKEADLYLPRHMSKYDFSLSIKNGIFTASGGIDESNGDGYYVLWPKDPQESANKIREFLKKKFGLKNIGVIITDSKTTPLRWGVTGVAVSHSGFRALNSYVGKPDIFGRIMKVEKLNVMDTLAAAVVGVMGEGSEQIPIAIVENASFVRFQPRSPTQKELTDLKISIEDDLYAPLITSVKWKKGKNRLVY